MTPAPVLQHFFAFAIAVEAERVVREHRESPAEEPPPITFTGPRDPSLELSIVIPAWNPQPAQFRRCLAALAHARLPGIAHEILVCDDASDTTVVGDLCARAAVPGMRYERATANRGGFGNFNWCLASARGEWIHLLHQDDWIEPDFYLELVRGGAASGAPMRYCRTQLNYEEAGQRRLMFDEAPAAGVLADFARRQSQAQRVQISGAIVRRAELALVGGYDARLGTGADWEYWLRWGARFPVYYSPRVLATYSLHEASWSTRATAGRHAADSLARHRLVLRRMLGHLPPAERVEAATGFYRTMLARLLAAAAANNRSGHSSENAALLRALLPACTEHGLGASLERLLLAAR